MMKIDLKKYFPIASEKFKSGETVDCVLQFLKKEQLPPGFSKIILVEVLKISSDEAQVLVYNSEAFKGFGEINDLFLDKLTGEKDDEK